MAFWLNKPHSRRAAPLLFVAAFLISVLANAQEPIQFLSSEHELSASEFATLWRAGQQQGLESAQSCKSNYIGLKSEIPDVFNDPNFQNRFAQDPLFQKISLFLYFNGATRIVPDELLPQFTVYAKAFYLLYKNGVIRSPDLNHVNAGDTIVLGMPNSLETLMAYKTIKENDIKFLHYDGAQQHFSYAMLNILMFMARFEPVCNMNTAEITAVAIYIGAGFLKLNPYLRTKKNDDPHLNLLKILTDRALDKIADSKRLVFRSTTFFGQHDMPEAVYRQHTVGSLVVYDAFTSTASYLIKDANFLIYSRTGKGLGRLSMEGEVLFKSNTRFRVRYNSCEHDQLKVWQGCNIMLDEIVPDLTH